MNLILVEPAELRPDGLVTLTGRRAAHIRDVLRAQPGQVVRAGVINGGAGTATVVRATPACVELEFGPLTVPDAGPDISLILALPRPKVIKRLWEPLASLGVRRILLTNAACVERNYFDTHWLGQAAFGPRLVLGLEQAGITRLPEVSVHRQFRPLIEDQLGVGFPASRRLLAHPTAKLRLRDLPASDGQPILLAIGPEGGWIPFELDLLHRHGFTAFAAGHGTLRSDVAAIALLALVREFVAS